MTWASVSPGASGWIPVDPCTGPLPPPVVPPGPPVATSLYYTATAGQTVFPLDTPDEFGNVATIGDEALFVYRSGNRLVYFDGYTVDVPDNTITLRYPAGAGEPIVFDVVSSTSEGPAGPAGPPGPTGGTLIAMDALPITTLNVIPPLSFTPDGVVLMLMVNGTTFFAVGPDAAFTVSGKVLTWTSTTFSIPPGAAVIAVYTHA